MARPDQIEQLDRRIAAAVDTAVRDFRNQLAERVRMAGAELSRVVDAAVPVLPPSFLSSGDLEPIVGHDRQTAKDGALQGLLEGARRIDEARNQVALLEALLQAAAAMSSRTGVFLTRGDELRGWRGVGFGDGIQSLDMLLFDIGETPWTDLASGTGCVPLSAGDCARIGSRLNAPMAQSGALIPLVLRDQVAAVLYADRLDEKAPWSLDALQLLTHLTALAIETLPFRQRPQTPTLRGLGSGEGLGMWTGTAATPATPAPPPDSEPAARADTAEPEITVTETLQTVAEVPASEDEELWPAEQEPIAATPFEEEVTPTPEWTAEPPAAPEAAALGMESSVEAAAEERPAVETSDAYWLLEDTVAPAPSPMATNIAGFEPLADVSLADLASGSTDRGDEAAPAEMTAEPPPVSSFDWSPAAHSAQSTSQVEPPAPPPLPLQTVAIPAPVTPIAAPPPSPALDDEATVMLQRPRQPEPAAPRPVPPYGAGPTTTDEPTHPGMRTAASTTSPIPVPPPVKTWQPGETAEVAPPPDLQGPGWAFATSRVPIITAASGEDQAVHDEARRLARLLVSEIKLYNEERVEDGRRNRDLYERLKEDIDRSRQMYEERVDARVSKNTDYFYQELVRILAAGDAKALGI